jgi:hypothetical protein
MTTENSNEEASATKSKKSATPVNKEKFDWRSLNTLAVVSLSSALSGVGSVPAIITGHISLAQIKRSNENGRVLAIVGTVLGYLGLVGAILFTIGAIALSARMGLDGYELHRGLDEMSEFRRGFGFRHDS